jgi:hypothetical protein
VPSLSTKRGKLFWGFFFILSLVAVSLGVLLYLATRPFELRFTQDPNPLDAHEANRKLNLLTEARDAKRQGWVRLSEVEINSLLEKQFNEPKKVRTQGPVELVKTGVLLHTNSLTFVTWLKMPVLGISLPLAWQRTVMPVKEGEHWTFEVQSMRLGHLDIPDRFWPNVNSFLNPSDAVFEERRAWLGKVPKVALMKNELSTAMELRLYSYVPPEKGAH